MTVTNGVRVQEGVNDASVYVGTIDRLDVSDPVDVIDAVVADTDALPVIDRVELREVDTVGVTDPVIADPLCELDAV